MQFGQFAGLSGLRFVDLSHNNLRSLARDAFQSTALESIDLSHNAFVAIPSSGMNGQILHIDLLRVTAGQSLSKYFVYPLPDMTI